MESIGTLEILRRYPVKSMKGEDLEEVFMSYGGLIGDRVYAFVDETDTSNFPWMTARQKGEIVLFKPRFRNAPRPEKQYPGMNEYSLDVETPGGKIFDIRDPDFTPYLAKRFGKPLTLRFSEKGMWDSRPISLFGMDTLRALESEIGFSLDHRRFRANCYVQWESSQPFFEDSLVGKTLQIGEKAKIVISKKDVRCVVVTLDPKTAAPTPEILTHLARVHENCAGVYAVVLQEGIVRRGDSVSVL